VLGEIKSAIEALSGDQQAAAEGFDRLARAVEASGAGEQVRGRRDARLAARAALRDGRPGAAVSLLVQAQKRAPDDAVANDLATAYVAAGRVKEAVELLEKVLAESPDYTPCRITLSSLKLKAGEPQAAEELLKDAPQPPDPLLRAELAYAKACAAYAVGRSEDAVDLLNKALDEDPWHAAAAAALMDLRARRTGVPVPEAAGLALEAVGVESRHG
jgi:tetratricopeptide (TPR) repeat protein